MNAFLARVNGKLIAANLYLGEHFVCGGKFFIEGQSALNGRFRPTDGKSLATFPPHGGVLRLSTEPQRIKVRNFHESKAQSGHFHFDFELIPADLKQGQTC